MTGRMSPILENLSNSKKMEELNPSELKAKLEKGENVKLIDVREPYEHEEYNIGGDLIPLAELMGRLGGMDEYRNQVIVVYCKSGNRSQMAQNIMQNAGFDDVYNLKGGMDQWREEIDTV